MEQGASYLRGKEWQPQGMTHRLGALAPVLVSVLLLASVFGCDASNRGDATLEPGVARAPSGIVSLSPRKDANQRCTSFSGTRLYTDVYPGSSAYNILALDANPDDPHPFLCEVTYAGLPYIGGLAVDKSGKLWAMNSGPPLALLAFPHGANGSVVPTQIIAGNQTHLAGPSTPGSQGIALDANGNVWVPCVYANYIVAFSNSANGDAAPIFTIGVGDNGKSEGINNPVGLAFDNGGNLYVADFTPYQVLVFSPPFTDSSKPVAVWGAPDRNAYSQYVSVDDKDDLFVGGQFTIEVYHRALKSNGVVSREILPPGANGFYDVKTANGGQIYASMIGGHGLKYRRSIGVLPSQARSFKDAQWITSPKFTSSPTSLALGL